MRAVLLRPGRCGWAVPSPGNPLPEGLAERESLFIIAMESPGLRARDSHGRIWQLERAQVDSGFYFGTPKGGWIHESTPRAQEYVRDELCRHLNTLRPDDEEGTEWDKRASQLLWILKRNENGEARREA